MDWNPSFECGILITIKHCVHSGCLLAEPEQRDYLRFVNFIIAPDFIVLLFVFVSAGLSVCGLYVSCRVSESVLVRTRGFCIESTRHCVVRVS